MLHIHTPCLFFPLNELNNKKKATKKIRKKSVTNMQLNEAAYHCHKLNWRLLLKIQPNAIYFDMKLNKTKKKKKTTTTKTERNKFFIFFLMETVEIPKENFWSSHLILRTKNCHNGVIYFYVFK